MPLYEYEGGKCSLRFELRRRFSENGNSFCPQCGSEAHRILQLVPIIFKGFWFYVTDSRNDRHGSLSDKGNDDKRDGKKESETKKRR